MLHQLLNLCEIVGRKTADHLNTRTRTENNCANNRNNQKNTNYNELAFTHDAFCRLLTRTEPRRAGDVNRECGTESGQLVVA